MVFGVTGDVMRLSYLWILGVDRGPQGEGGVGHVVVDAHGEVPLRNLLRRPG